MPVFTVVFSPGCLCFAWVLVPTVNVEPDEHGTKLFPWSSDFLGLAVIMLGSSHARNDAIDEHADEHAGNGDNECAHERVLGQQ